MMTNKYVFLGMMLSLLPMSMTVLAANYNLQPYTTCRQDGFCYTALDVSTLGLNAQRINNLKTVNITNFLNKSSPFGIENITYSWTGNFLNISGFADIGTSTYWSFGVGGDSFDPWWNVTTTTTAIWINPESMGSNSAWPNFCLGLNLTAVSTHIDNVTKYTTSNVTFVEIRAQNGTQIENASFGTSNFTTFSSNVLVTGQIYYLGFCGPDSRHAYKNGVSWPKTGNGIKATDSVYCTNYLSCTYNNDTVRGIYDVYSIGNSNTTTTSTYYTTNFTLNGYETNVTYTTPYTVNINAGANLTNLNITIFQNDIVKNSTIGNGTYIAANLTAGIYNFTMTTNNSDVITRWAIITAPAPPIDTNICFKTKPVCIDTLTNKVYINGKQQ